MVQEFFTCMYSVTHEFTDPPFMSPPGMLEAHKMYDIKLFSLPERYSLDFACSFIVPILDYLGCWILICVEILGVLSASLRPILDSNLQSLPRSRYPQLQTLTPPCIFAVTTPSRR
ncbi:hypothetical protein BYT27DRAFT_6819183 [Phlegmacium glaucopus]|nr:hypothetical protein BYT27DRAFT_6819183 [Phlegmacium glaucopus]